jgi:hypothetical protein
MKNFDRILDDFRSVLSIKFPLRLLRPTPLQLLPTVPLLPLPTAQLPLSVLPTAPLLRVRTLVNLGVGLVIFSLCDYPSKLFKYLFICRNKHECILYAVLRLNLNI